MAVQGAVGIAVRHAAVIDDDIVAIAAAGPACHLHIAAGGCVDGRTARGRQIDAGMQPVDAGHRILTPAVLAGNAGIALQRAGKAGKAQLRLTGCSRCDRLLDLFFDCLIVQLVRFNGRLRCLLGLLGVLCRELCRRDAAVQLALLGLHLVVLGIQLCLLALQLLALGFQLHLICFQSALGGLHIVHDLGIFDGDILHDLVEGQQLIQVVHRAQHGHTAAIAQLLHRRHMLFEIVPLAVDLGLLLGDLRFLGADLLLGLADAVLHRRDLGAQHTDLRLNDAHALLQLTFQRLCRSFLFLCVRKLLFVLVDGFGKAVQLVLQAGHTGGCRGRVKAYACHKTRGRQTQADAPQQLTAGRLRPGMARRVAGHLKPEGLCMKCFFHVRLLSIIHSGVCGWRTCCPDHPQQHRR